MELEHAFTVPVTPAEAFAVLRDIERIGPCMPGATIDTVDGDAFTGRVKVKIGPIQVTYRGEANYVDVDEEALTASIDARGRESRGSGTANAQVRAAISEVDGGARVTGVTDLAITGKPAQFGRGVMEDVGGKLIGQFADCLAAELSAGGAAAPADGVAESRASGGAGATAPLGEGPDGNGAAPAAAAPEADAADTASQAPAAAADSPRPTDDAIDLLEVAGAPLAKRAAPVAVGVAVLLLILWLLGRRR